MKERYNIKGIRLIIADCAWKLRKAYAEENKQEFNYQWEHFAGYAIIGFISDSAFHRGLLMSYEMM